jgi:hypothetical protein
VAFALMQHFPHGIHIPVDDVREFVVSGIAHPVPVWTDETTRQFELARKSAATIARLYNSAGFAVVIDDVIFPDAARLFDELFADLSFTKVLLRPTLEATLVRNQRRTNKAFDTTLLNDTIQVLYQEMNPQVFAKNGWQIVNNTTLTIEETVDQILAG